MLSKCLRHVVDDRYNQETGEKRRNTAKQRWPVTGGNWIAVIHVVDDDEKRETGDAVVGIEDKEGRRTDALKRLVLQGNTNTSEKLCEGLHQCFTV